MQYKIGEEVHNSEPNESLWYLLGLRSSLSIRLILLSIFPCALSPIFIDRANYGGSILLWLGLISLAHIGFSICILITGNFIHRSGDYESHPVATLLAFMLAQGVRGSILGFSTVVLGFSDDPKLAFRILSGGVFISTVLSVIAISIAVFDQHSSLVRILVAKSNELSHLQLTLDTRVQEAMRNLRQYAQQVVTPRIDQIDELLIGIISGGNKSQAIAQMQNFIDNELRPFSHQIAHDKSLADIEIYTERLNKNFQLPAKINLSQSIRPYVSTILFFITCAAAAQRTMTWVESLPFILVTTILLITYFTLLRKLLGNLEVSLAIGLPIGASIFGITGPLILHVESLMQIQIPQHISGATIFIGLIYGFANLGYTILTSQRTLMITELTSIIENLESTISLLNQKGWISRRQVGYVMHGSLQGALNAAVIRLGSTIDPTSELIASVRSDIASALARVGFEPGQEYSFEQAQREITQIWAGAIVINWNVAPEIFTVLRRNPATSECLAEVLRESVGNASKHGRATKVEIVLSVEERTLLLQVEDNGRSTVTGGAPGLGSELYDDVCSRWDLVRTQLDGMKLTANLALEHAAKS